MNVPDDWNSYYMNCSLCGGRYHASEGGCYCTEDKELCEGENCGDAYDLDSYHDFRELKKLGGKHYCKECLVCQECNAQEGVTYVEDADCLLCPACEDEVA